MVMLIGKLINGTNMLITHKMPATVLNKLAEGEEAEKRFCS